MLVWVHGGAFIFGGNKLYNPEYMMEEDIVLVVVQYRLNIFGFMSLEDSSLPGNYGMLDQVEALKWVQENIEAYGGDPEKVTIIGMSAGGASVHYLTLSPMTTHLYKNAISLSGSALCWWANIPHPKDRAHALLKEFKCKTADCMRKVPSDKLMKAHHDLFFEWHKEYVEREPMNVFSPRSDPEAGPEAFLPDHPYVAMEKGKVNPQPHMIGFTDKEGIWRANQLLPDGTGRSRSTWHDFLANFDKLAPMAFGVFEGQTRNPGFVATKIKEYYNLDKLTDEDVTDEMADNLIDALSDSMFSYAIDESAKMRSKLKNMNTYYHYFTYSGEHTLANLGIDHNIRRPPLKPLW